VRSQPLVIREELLVTSEEEEKEDEDLLACLQHIAE